MVDFIRGCELREEEPQGTISILSILIDAWNVVIVLTKAPAVLAMSSLRDRGSNGGHVVSMQGSSLVLSPLCNFMHLTSVTWCGLRWFMRG